MTVLPSPSSKSVKLVGSWEVRAKGEQKRILADLLEEFPFLKERSLPSYLREWRAHNLLYGLGLFRSHTADVDLDAGEPLWRRAIYWALGF